MKGVKMHRWSDEETAFVRANLHLTKRQMAAEITERFGFACTMNMLKNVFKRYRFNSGRTGYFTKGQEPFNKGRKGLNPRSVTSFQDGNRPHNAVEVGTERITKDGLIEVKTADPNTWRSKHAIMWERHHNATVPDGHVVIFADRDRRNFTTNNLLLVSKAELVVMNKFKLIFYCAEATKAGRTVAKVMLATSKRRGKRMRRRMGAIARI